MQTFNKYTAKRIEKKTFRLSETKYRRNRERKSARTINRPCSGLSTENFGRRFVLCKPPGVTREFRIIKFAVDNPLNVHYTKL